MATRTCKKRPVKKLKAAKGLELDKVALAELEATASAPPPPVDTSVHDINANNEEWYGYG